jgi:hypothetical protein
MLIKIDFEEEYEGEDRVHVTQDRDKLQSLLNKIIHAYIKKDVMS